MVNYMMHPEIKKPRFSQLKRGFIYCVPLAVICFAPYTSAYADEVLHDPTRPPTVLFAPQERETIDVGPVLQSVSLASGRRTAIISGQNVKTGSKIGEARVISINETEVVLKTGNSLQTLKLFPDVEKHSVVKIRRHRN
jgi:MSHA biogenesis protein MshK